MKTDPKNLDECLAILDKEVSEEDKEKLRSGDLTPTEVHHTLGQYLRNAWHLWGESDLKKWFLSIGIHHPDDMSGIILDSFVSHLKGEPIDLDGQVDYYIRYWKKTMNDPKGFILAKENGKWSIQNRKRK